MSERQCVELLQREGLLQMTQGNANVSPTLDNKGRGRSKVWMRTITFWLFTTTIRVTSI